MFEELEKADPALKKMVKDIYDCAIDFGAHPNEKSLSSNLDRIEMDTIVEFRLNYLVKDKGYIEMCLRSVAQTGIYSLKMMELIIPERFKMSLLSDKLTKPGKGL